MVKVNIGQQSANSTNKSKEISTKQQQKVFKSHRKMPALNAVERFVESISQGNDSANFDASFEIKHILSPKVDDVPASKTLVRHRCVTELDREKIEQFVRDFEQRQYRNTCDKNNNESSPSKVTPKSSPYLYRKAKSIYQNSWIGSRNSSPRACTPTDQLLAEHALEPSELQRNSMPERVSYRSAAKMLQFFASKKPKSPNKQISSNSDLENTSGNSSPILRHSHVVSSDDEHYDGIDSQGNSSEYTSNSSDSRNTSPDCSFEMHPPLVPVFKVTPPPGARLKNNRNAAYEFARFLRGSFHAKRASITVLRRSISDSQNFDNVDFTRPQTKCTKTKTGTSMQGTFTSKVADNILADTTNNTHVKHDKQPVQPKAQSLRVSHF